MVSQNILNLVDTAMVGTLGDEALAAVGLGSFATFMSVAFFQGFASSVQAIASRRVGEGRAQQAAWPLNGSLLLIVLAGLPVALALYHTAPWLMSLLISDQKVLDVATPYYQLRVLGTIAVGTNFAFRGYWNGTDRSKMYMSTLWFMHACNVFFNYILIFGKLGAPAMGAEGAALGTTISLYIGSLTYLVLGWFQARGEGFLQRLPRRQTIVNLTRLLLPAGLQQFLFAAGMTILTTIVGMVGTPELAATNVLINLLLVVILIEVGFGVAAGALAGQALGAEDVGEAKAWVATVVRLSLLVTVPLSVVAIFIPDLLLAPFIHEPETLALARTPLRLIALALPLDSFGMVYLQALQGVGDQKRVMAVVVGTQWLLFLPLSYWIGPVLGFGLTGIWLVHLGYRALQAFLLALAWRGEAWTKLKV